MNISSTLPPEHRIASLFTTIGQPTRLQILMAIGAEEVCVCHLESVLKIRQAVISQHLIQLKNNDLVVSRKKARYHFYRLARPELLSVISSAAAYLSISEEQVQQLYPIPAEGCFCPMCAGDGEENKKCR